MNRRIQYLLFLAGAAILAVLLNRIGPAALATDIARTGWWLLPITLIYLPVYALNAVAWHLTLAGERGRPPFPRLLAITISGFAINYLTPVISLGGEPYKVAAIAPHVGGRRATGSVIVFTMLHAFSHLLIWLTAVVGALLALTPPPAFATVLVVLGVIISALTAFIFARHRKGVLEGLVDLLGRVPLLRRLARRLEVHREALEDIDRQITDFYHLDRRRFWLALVLEYVSRALSMLEYWFIFLSLGIPLGLGHAFLIGAFSSLIMNILFFMPFELGSKEGGLFALFELIAGRGATGVTASIVSRLRELAWIVVGLLLIWVGAAPRRATGRVGVNAEVGGEDIPTSE
jgi:uncharacterized protein (TIRG00374 family)